jgi:cytoskeletal protein RodZ
MKEIGLKLKTKREENGLSVLEVADDLKVTASDISDLEEGLRDNFKDIDKLKTLIGEYAKYLGFDREEMIDKFNEYLFEQTSRISLEDIQKAKELKEKKEKNKISSPYTIEKKEKNKVIIGIVVAVILIFVFFISYFVVNKIVMDKKTSDIGVSYLIGGE